MEIADDLYNESLKILNDMSSKTFTTYSIPQQKFSWFFNTLKHTISKFILIRVTSQQEDIEIGKYGKGSQIIRVSSMLKKAAELGNNDALYLLGDMHFVCII